MSILRLRSIAREFLESEFCLEKISKLHDEISFSIDMVKSSSRKAPSEKLRNKEIRVLEEGHLPAPPGWYGIVCTSKKRIILL